MPAPQNGAVSKTADAVRLVVSSRVVWWVALACWLGWYVNHTWGPAYGHAHFYKPAHWILVICLCTIGLAFGCEHFFRRAPRLPLRHSTIEVSVEAVRDVLQSPFPLVDSVARAPSQLLHALYLTGALVLWIYFADSAEPGTSAAYRRLLENLDLVNHASVWWVALGPSLFMQCMVPLLARRPSPSAWGSGAVSWAWGGLCAKAALATLSVPLLDPSNDSIWSRADPASDAQIAVITVAAGLVGLGVTVYWMRYRAVHAEGGPDAELPGAFHDFAGTLSLTLLCSWQLTARLRNKHAAIADQAVSAMFAFHMAYAVAGTLGVLALPVNAHTRKSDATPEASVEFAAIPSTNLSTENI
jgi:hypothetical protein